MLWQIKQPARHGALPTVKELFFCVFSALLLIVSFLAHNSWLFAWFGFVPLFTVLRNKPRTKAFLLAYITGIIFWLGTIYWLMHVTFAGMVLLSLYLALYFGVFGFLSSNFFLRLSVFSIFFIPSLWVLLEYARSYFLTGFPWALLGYSQYLNLLVIQITDITGAWGVSFLVVMINICVYWVSGVRCQVMGDGCWVLGKINKCLIPLACLALVLGYGFYKIYLTPSTQHLIPLKISIIQGNIPQELKWDRRAKDFIVNKYLGITSMALMNKTDLIVWPEAAMPVVFGEEPGYFDKVQALIKKNQIPLLLGMVRPKGDFYYNSAALISKEGKFLAIHDKIHLVPFGEYIPLRKILPFLERVVPIGDFLGGKEYTVFNLPAKSAVKQARFGVLICFEDAFPQLSREFVKKGVSFLVNITNDAWFKQTSAAYQHVAASVFRAVENRVVLVRAANTGVSAFISSTGKIISKVSEAGKDTFVDGYKTEVIPLANTPLSFYTRHGDIFVFFCFLLVAFGLVKLKIKPGKSVT